MTPAGFVVPVKIQAYPSLFLAYDILVFRSYELLRLKSNVPERFVSPSDEPLVSQLYFASTLNLVIARQSPHLQKDPQLQSPRARGQALSDALRSA